MICSDNLLVKASVALFLVVVLPITNIYFWLVVRSLKRRLEMDDAIGYDENRIQVPKFSVTRFGQIMQLWPNFEVFELLLNIGVILSLLWQVCYAIRQIYSLLYLNVQNCTTNLAIWSHCTNKCLTISAIKRMVHQLFYTIGTNLCVP